MFRIPITIINSVRHIVSKSCFAPDNAKCELYLPAISSRAYYACVQRFSLVGRVYRIIYHNNSTSVPPTGISIIIIIYRFVFRPIVIFPSWLQNTDLRGLNNDIIILVLCTKQCGKPHTATVKPDTRRITGHDIIRIT